MPEFYEAKFYEVVLHSYLIEVIKKTNQISYLVKSYLYVFIGPFRIHNYVYGNMAFRPSRRYV